MRRMLLGLLLMGCTHATDPQDAPQPARSTTYQRDMTFFLPLRESYNCQRYAFGDTVRYEQIEIWIMEKPAPARYAGSQPLPELGGVWVSMTIALPKRPVLVKLRAIDTDGRVGCFSNALDAPYTPPEDVATP